MINTNYSNNSYLNINKQKAPSFKAGLAEAWKVADGVKTELIYSEKLPGSDPSIKELLEQALKCIKESPGMQFITEKTCAKPETCKKVFTDTSIRKKGKYYPDPVINIWPLDSSRNIIRFEKAPENGISGKTWIYDVHPEGESQENLELMRKIEQVFDQRFAGQKN